MLNAEKILADFCHFGSKAYDVLLNHGTRVAKKSIEILDGMSNIENVDRNFIIEASILHDIGICKTNAKFIGCNGSLPYLCHGVEGRKILDKIGLHRHGLVCERHVGVGLLLKDIITMQLPLPNRDMKPISFEEKLICYSDKFFSKNLGNTEKNIETVLSDIKCYGNKSVIRFLKLHNYFMGKN